MKANQSIKNLKQDQTGYVKIVGGLVALLLMIIVGVMIFWSVSESIPGTGEQTETFTGYAASANASAWSVTLDYSPTGSSAVNVTAYNATGSSESYPVFTLSHMTVSVAADAADEFSQVNVTYTSNIGSSAGEADDMASTVFGLLPIIALVVVAAIIIGVIIGFGGGSGKKL